MRLHLGEVDRIDEDEHPMPGISGHLGPVVARHLQHRRLGTVLPVEPHQAEHQDGEDHHDQPGPLRELGHREDPTTIVDKIPADRLIPSL